MKPDEIKALRKLLGLSQRDLAKFLKVSPTTVARWELDQVKAGGLGQDVLRGMAAAVALAKDDPVKLAVARGLVTLGVGQLVYMALIRS